MLIVSRWLSSECCWVHMWETGGPSLLVAVPRCVDAHLQGWRDALRPFLFTYIRPGNICIKSDKHLENGANMSHTRRLSSWILLQLRQGRANRRRPWRAGAEQRRLTLWGPALAPDAFTGKTDSVCVWGWEFKCQQRQSDWCSDSSANL